MRNMKQLRSEDLHRYMAIAFRGTLALACMELADTALFYEESMPYRMVEYGGWEARLITIAQMVVALVAFLDVVVCDVFGRLPRLRTLRLHLWLLMGAGYGLQGFGAWHYDFWPRLGLLYLFQGFACAFIAWAEMQLRFERACEEQRDTGLADLRDV